VTIRLKGWKEKSVVSTKGGFCWVQRKVDSEIQGALPQGRGNMIRGERGSLAKEMCLIIYDRRRRNGKHHNTGGGKESVMIG